MQHFYDGQIRRYITQLIRLFSNFKYKDGEGKEVKIPVLYGDLSRQVASIVRDQSENKLPSAPRMALYITQLEQDRTRTSDSSFTSKVHIRERAFDEAGNEYLNTQGKNYTVERLMPTPYNLSVNLDIWSTNTDMKLQIMEQLLMLFNPSLEIQTTDNYVDWTSLTSVELTNINFTNRSIPAGTDSEIDIAQLGFITPIYLNMPAKVKKLGVITYVVMSIFDETKVTIDLKTSMPELQAYSDSENNQPKTDLQTGLVEKDGIKIMTGNYQDYDVLVMGNIAQVVDRGKVGTIDWIKVLDPHPGEYRAGLSQIMLRRKLIEGESGSISINGTITINELDRTQLLITWDQDTIPTNTNLTTPSGRNNQGSVDFIIDPGKFNPTTAKTAGLRLLLLGAINTSKNVNEASYDGPDAWKNVDGTEFVAGENDIVEWDGTQWHVVFDASTDDGSTTKYITNLNTGVQYRWTGTEWILSWEGEYQKGTWRLAL